MDASTLRYYSQNAQTVAERYEGIKSPLADRFASVFKAGGRILDIGCGSGRDLAELARQGYQAYGIDATAELVNLAQQLHPELHGRVLQAALPDFDVPFGGDFDAVLCSAVLMHIDAPALPGAALAIKRCLKVNGRLLISVPSQRSDINDKERDTNGRLFKAHSLDCLRVIFERLDFSLLGEWQNEDALNRQGVDWVTLLFKVATQADAQRIGA